MRRVLPMIVLAVLTQYATAGDNWPQFRGPTGNGVSDAVGLPLTWSETENIAWKTPIHDRGWSSPVIWGTQIWLTTATEDGKRLFAVCVDRDSGSVTHDVKVFDVTKPESIAKVNSYASPTPVIEDGRVYLHYGTYGTACLNTQTGEILWTRRDLNCDHEMGPGASPILHGDLLIFTVDGCDVQYVVALDKRTGKTAWKTDRTVDLSGVPYGTRKGYGTPTVYRTGDRLEMITPASRALFAYDPQSGSDCNSTCPQTAPSVVVSEAQGCDGTSDHALSRQIHQPRVGSCPTLLASPQRSVGESMSPCPKAGCGKTARPV